MTRSSISLLAILLVTVSLAATPAEIRGNADRMEQRIKALSAFGANEDGGVDRVAFSEADIAGRAYIMELMQEAGLAVRLDTAGNIIGRREGSEPDLPVILFGSHIDSVPGGGNYDGDVGVIGAIEVAQLMQDNDIRTRHPLEVVSFSLAAGRWLVTLMSGL
jgi:N-carbamoyl-L-amino-acid hydrolase